ncbi:2'-5' RNA ligase family protein [Flavihumibacter sp. R14]|nr:2'-5' RNA ligase family protein [Flavihumibacter soli]
MKGLYLIALLPGADISEQIHEIRLECSEKFDVYKALRPPVHITLYPPFYFDEANEKRLIYVLHQQTRGLSSFTQLIANFGHFRKEVVFVNALNSPGLTSLHESIIAVFRKANDKQVFKPVAFHPHLTIAYRDITPEKFDRIWGEYNNREYKTSFIADHFTLLKHDRIKWNPIANFKLGGTGQPSGW